MAATPLEVRLLGPLEVCAGDVRLRIAGTKPRALLAVLALDAGRALAGDRLIDELWPDEPPATVRTALAVNVSRLRAAIGKTAIETTDAGYRLAIEPEAVDVGRFRRLVAAHLYDDALALWRGDALAGLAFGGRSAAVAELDELRLQAELGSIDSALDEGSHERVLGSLHALAERYPYDERFRERLMVALYRSHRHIEAADVYRRTTRAFRRELGIDPSPALGDLMHAVLQHDPQLDVESRTVADEALEFACAFAEQAQVELATSSRGDWLPRFDAVAPAAERTIVACLRSGRSEPAARLSVALWRYWRARGRLATAHRLMALALDHQLQPRLRARALMADAYLQHEQRLNDGAARRAGELCALGEALGEPYWLTSGFNVAAVVAHDAGDSETAAAYFREALTAAQHTGSDSAVAAVTGNACAFAAEQGNADAAEAGTIEALEHARACGDVSTEAMLLLNLATILCDRGEYDRAAAVADETLARMAPLGLATEQPRLFDVLAAAAMGRGEPEPAVRFLGLAEAARDALETDRVPAWNRYRVRETSTMARAALGAASFESAYRGGRAAG